jgi:hypothetical protein
VPTTCSPPAPLAVRSGAQFRSGWRVAFLVALAGVVSMIAAASPGNEASAKRSKQKATTTLPGPTAPPDALSVALIVDSVRTQALPEGVRVGASIGTPTCAAPTKKTPGLTFQCLVPFGGSSIPYLVTVINATSVQARPTFPLVRQQDLVDAAKRKATGTVNCGRPGVRALPMGTIVECTVQQGKKSVTVQVRVKDERGVVEPV